MRAWPIAAPLLALSLAACGAGGPPARPKIPWIHNPAEGMAKAKQLNKPVLIDFGSPD